LEINSNDNEVNVENKYFCANNIDAIVGTYIGAINGAVLVSPVIENKRRDD
jgi:hypothetical protein